MTPTLTPPPDTTPTPETLARQRNRGGPRDAGKSGDQQAGTELCSVQVEEISVPLGPPTRVQVGAEAVHHPLLDVRADGCPDRDAAANALVQVGLGSPPVRL